jgi:hypothetical protein
MVDIRTLFTAIDQLEPRELIQLRDYVERRAQTLIWTLSPDQLRAIDDVLRPVQAEAADMSEEEVKTILDEAINDVRHERQAKSRG